MLVVPLVVFLAACKPAPAQQSAGLCVGGHPAPRAPDVTYAYLAPRHGFQRDHIVPLCLGGSDTADNVQYQSLAEAHVKDTLEWRMCEDYCAGRISLGDARRVFK
jgi:hypothetical protein